MKTGVELIAEERQRQVSKEGYTEKHDKAHTCGDLALAAACYALPSRVRNKTPMMDKPGPGQVPLWAILWPWSVCWWKPSADDRIKELKKAGALCAAEIDRLLLAETVKKP